MQVSCLKKQFFYINLFTKALFRDKIIMIVVYLRRSKFKDMSTAAIYTLGCKVNQYESEAIAERLGLLGFRILPPSSVCDVYIINTCTVTAESDRKARQFIRRAITKNPSAYIIVTGCLAQTAARRLTEIVGIDAIVGNTGKLYCADIAAELCQKNEKCAEPRIYVEDIANAEFEKMSICRFDRTRAYIKIEDGCENRCTYCIIPSARGQVRSKHPDAVIAEARHFAELGCPEVVLTGIETASYGKDLGDTSLCELLERVDKIDGIGRVRLGSLDPSLITPAFAKRISALHSLSPHFHLSLQSGSSKILALMKRKYNARQAMNAIELLRENITGVQFTTDVIVGFPNESEEDFEQTCDFVRKAGFLQVHIFPYSKRQGTLAATMSGQVPEEIKKERLHILEKIAAKSKADILQAEVQRGQAVQVLFETYKAGVAYGHTASFMEVAAGSDAPLSGRLCNVRLTHTDGNICYGEIID